MCGIVGILGRDTKVTESCVQRMCAEITHRGPDDEGHSLHTQCGLGMRRLSIIDLNTGHQPIGNEDRTCWIVFNGEIYNYRELRNDLQQRGHRFSTKTDTETILHLYEELGEQCVEKLNGMFAIAIWDTARQRLFLARDRMGIKPLYYGLHGGCFLFASEIKSILSADVMPREVNPRAIWDYLTFRYIPQPMTIWKGIHKLPPGHTLSLEPPFERPVTKRYWDIPYPEHPEIRTEAEDQAEFDSLFLDTVKRRLIADVPVGILLSGGLDSSAVAAAVSEVHNTPLSTFSVAFDDKDAFSELPYAREVAQRYRTDHHEIQINLQDFIDFLPQFVWHTDEPLADPASVPLYFVSKLAAEHVKVVLSGEGADEVLAGYTMENLCAYWDKIRAFHRVPRWIRDGLPRSLFQALGHTRGCERIDRLNVPLAERNRLLLPHMTNYFSTEEKRSLWPDVADFRDSEEIVAGYYERSQSRDPLNQVLYAYSQDWLVEDLLMKADKMTMANSIELRVPFLDHRMVEWLASRPAERKVRPEPGGKYTTKYMLRRFARERLPETILTREKRGFPVPLTHWVRGELGTVMADKLLAKDAYVSSLFRREKLNELLRAARESNSAAEVQRVWIVFVLEMWAQRWL